MFSDKRQWCRLDTGLHVEPYQHDFSRDSRLTPTPTRRLRLHSHCHRITAFHPCHRFHPQLAFYLAQMLQATTDCINTIMHPCLSAFSGTSAKSCECVSVCVGERSSDTVKWSLAKRSCNSCCFKDFSEGHTFSLIGRVKPLTEGHFLNLNMGLGLEWAKLNACLKVYVHPHWYACLCPDLCCEYVTV